MKAVVFAGGVGTRLWPLSRKKSPKQFEKVVGDQSTLQLAVARLFPDFSWNDIYVATTKEYVSLVQKQLPELAGDHIIAEPAMRDVGPAVGLATSILAKENPDEPFVILWSDHLVKNQELFRSIIQIARTKIAKDKNKIVFIGQKPRFASQNLGWIEFGKIIQKHKDIRLHEFRRFKYRPSLSEANDFFKSKQFAWNLGYFVTTPSFLLSQYKKFAPDTATKLKTIQNAWATASFEHVLERIYPTIEKMHFDTCILENLDPSSAYVIAEDIKWSDVGAWEALKEALQKNSEENVIKGKVMVIDSSDSLIYNFTDQTVIGIDVSELMIINTEDVVLICHKNAVPKIKQLVESFVGTEHEHLI